MTRDHVGFEQDALAERLFHCCIEEFGAELPAHDARTVDGFLLAHFNDHGVPAAYEVDGILQPARRCAEWPCRLCGLAFAWFELIWYRHNVAQADAAEMRLCAAETVPELDPRRLELQRNRCAEPILKVA